MKSIEEKILYVLGAGLLVAATLLLFRALILHLEWTRWGGSYDYGWLARSAVIDSAEDFVVVLSLMVAFTVFPIGVLAVRLLYLLSLLVVSAFGAANIKVSMYYDGPVTVGLLHFAGMTDLGALFTLWDYVSVADLIGLAITPLVVFAVPALLARRWHLRFGGARAVRGLSIVLCCGAAAVAWAAYKGWTLQADPRANGNAAVRLILSLFEPDPLSAFPRGEDGGSNPLAQAVPTKTGTEFGATSTVPKNAIVVVLESVGSSYVDLSRPDTSMPRLASLRPISAYFPNAYVQSPSSAIALYTLFAGQYAPITMASMPGAAPDLATPTVFSVAKSHGYRTGVFFSAGWRYAGYSDFLQFQGVDRIEDRWGRSNCDGQYLNSTAAGAADADDFSATTDLCTLESMKRWIKSGSKPFISVLWTNQTHYPYRPKVDEAFLSEEMPDTFQRYVQAIDVADRLIERLVQWLQDEKALDETLIVVVGDHGEGFGQHGVYVHGNDLYEEFVRVPVVMINRNLFSGQIRRDPVGHIDVAPTILDALGLDIPHGWHGLSMLGDTVHKRLFFMVPWADVKLGYVEAGTKVIYSLLDSRMAAYALADDPLEQRPSTVVADRLEPLRAWKKAVDDHYRALGLP